MILLLILCFFLPFSSYANVTATVESQNVTEGQIIEFRLSSDTKKSEAPNLTELEKDFHIMGTMTSSSYQNINGRATSSYDFILNLLPKKTGVITIPAILWENESSEQINVSVKPASTSAETQSKNTVTIKGSIVEEQVYENASLTYRVEVTSDLDFINSRFIPPEMEDAQIMTIGDVKIGQKVQDNVVLRTLTQDYAIFPQKPGTKQTLKGAGFQGLFLKIKNSRRSSLEPFIYGPISTPKEQIFLRAEDVAVDVLSRPDSWKNKWWLPAQRVNLSESYIDSQEENLKVGDSITRMIEAKAIGVMGVQIPDINISSSEDFKVYAETAQKDTFYQPAVGVIGQMTQSFVFVPLREGLLNLPEIKLTWFDTTTGQAQIATLPAKEISVSPNNLIKKNEEKPQPQPTVQPQNTTDNEQGKLPLKENKYAQENHFLYFVAGVAVGLILMIICMIFVFYRPKKKKLPDLYPDK